MNPVLGIDIQLPAGSPDVGSGRRQRTLMKLAELRLNILSASLIGAFRRVAVPGPFPPAVDVVVEPLM